ncbi:lipid IV(A) 3-deoxy-D-manno-octulosonic acid transferase [Caldimonas manganoxidans]|uniref:lipid IV(A) 3-deoxy-D-manno-octulosonic acid transferase n=1 Tax=Caldimonas manganoxidans TaxID=196015 RepID=UPI000380884E
MIELAGRASERWARRLYSVALWLLQPLYVARLCWRARREPLYRHRLAERFGWYDGPAPPPGAVWLHAVSLGETRAAAGLVKALRERCPQLRLLLTHATATGRQAGQALLQPGDRQVWLPFDTPGAVARFLAHHRPALGLLMETEIWPNLQHAAAVCGVPMVLVNARLSERSLRRGQRLGVLMRPAVRQLRWALAQTQADAQRLREAGVEHVEVCGNLKFDMTPQPELLALGRGWRAAWEVAGPRPVVLAASTREGEEAALLRAWQALPQPRPLLLLVPRHPQRFDEVAALVQAAGLDLVRRSSWGAQRPEASAGRADVCLGDSLGEMPAYYAAADVALLGGSFEPLGGQNLIEAAACGCPIVMGPHTFNFAEAAELAWQAGAACRVQTLSQGVQEAVALAVDSGRREDMATRARRFAAAHRGAAQRMAERVLGLLLPTGDSARQQVVDRGQIVG